MTRSNLSPWAVWGLYLFAGVLIASPLIDLFSTAWPLRPADVSWRYGFLGLAAGYLHTPMLGAVLAMAVAYWQGHASALRALGIVGLAVAAVLLPVLALWPMDVLQMRALRPPEGRSGIVIGGAIQEIKYLGTCVVLGCLGLGSVGTSVDLRGAERKEAPGILRRD